MELGWRIQGKNLLCLLFEVAEHLAVCKETWLTSVEQLVLRCEILPGCFGRVLTQWRKLLVSFQSVYYCGTGLGRLQGLTSVSLVPPAHSKTRQTIQLTF